jgi:uncharacterized protein DUF2844
MIQRFQLGVLFLAALIASAPRASAALGEPVRSVEGDLVMMQGDLKIIPGEGFTVHQITTKAGITVKEYVSADGVVFGVSWRGAVFPDLSRLLGTYFAQFQRAATAQAPFRRRHIMVHTAQLVAETGGHMRDLRGRAYLPAMLPAGVGGATVE